LHKILVSCTEKKQKGYYKYKKILKIMKRWEVYMNLSYIRYFVELAHVQHYTNAARNLNITQPSLSHAISQLE